MLTLLSIAYAHARPEKGDDDEEDGNVVGDVDGQMDDDQLFDMLQNMIDILTSGVYKVIKLEYIHL